MRRVYAPLSLAQRHGDARLDATCATALKAGMLDVNRLQRMVERAAPTSRNEPAAATASRPRHARTAASSSDSPPLPIRCARRVLSTA